MADSNATEFDFEFSDSLVLNLDELAEEPEERDVLPSGTYDAEVISAEFTKAKSGAPMVRWTFQTTDPDHGNTRFWDYTVLNNQIGINNFRNHIVATGADVDLSDVSPAEINDAVTGSDVRVRVVKGSYNGRPNHDVKGVYPPTGEDAGEDFLS